MTTLFSVRGPQPETEALGPKIRRQRRRLGLTLDELSGRASISKPYLSLIENGRVVNPPSDEKLGRLEQTLGFTAGELLAQAHLQRTPKDVREVLDKLMSASGVPVINRMSAGYPRDFCDLQYPPRVASEYLTCPDVTDRQAFAARVHGDSMSPKYRAGDIAIFSPALSARDGDDCFVRFADGQTTFNRVFFESTESNHPVLRLQPRNERHRAQTVAAEKVAGLYKAVYRYQRVEEE